jgi:hypothetical protein
MSKPKPYRCPSTGKIQYANAVQAEKYLLKERIRLNDPGISSYICHHCGFYHLGHTHKARKHGIPRWRRGS